MAKGRGWHGDAEGHRQAALKADERWYQTQWRLTKDMAGMLVRNFGVRDTPRLLFWFSVYGTLALIATVLWAVTRVVVWPYRALMWAWGRMKRAAGRVGGR